MSATFTDVAKNVRIDFFVNIGILLAAILGFYFIASFADVIIKYTTSRNQRKIERIRKRLAFAYTKSVASILVQTLALCLNLASCGIFVYLTVQVSELVPFIDDSTQFASGVDFTVVQNNYKAIFSQKWLIVVECLISTILIGEYIWEWILSDNKIRYVLTVINIITILSAIPGLAAPALGYYFYGYQFFRILQVTKVIRSLSTNGYFPFSSFKIQLVVLISNIVGVVISAASIMFVMENVATLPNAALRNLLDALYYIIVTMSTVGYGDIGPRTLEGRVIVMILIALGLAFIPGQIDKFVKLFHENSRFAQYNGRGHIILCVHRAESVIPWLQEFFHPDRTDSQTNVCVLFREEEIPREVEIYLRQPKIDFRVMKLHGSLLVDVDLVRVGLSDAIAVMILADKYAIDPEEEDAKTIMEVFAVRRENATIPLYVQILTPKQKHAMDSANVNGVMCIEELRMGFLVTNTICPGLSTLLANLGISSNLPTLTKNDSWLNNYVEGMGNELYLVNDMAKYEGLRFGDVVAAIYKAHGILMIGILVLDKVEAVDLGTQRRKKVSSFLLDLAEQEQEDAVSQLLLNPGMDRIFTKEDGVLIMAQDESAIELIEEFDISTISKESITLNSSNNNNILTQKCIYNSIGDSMHKFDPKYIAFDRKVFASYEEIHIDEPVVLIGPWNEVAIFVENFYRLCTKELIPIIIINTNVPDDQLWKRICWFPIHVYPGSPSDTNDLEKAGVFDSRAVVVLGDRVNADMSVDAKPIMYFNLIKASVPFALVDIVYLSNAKYLGSFMKKLRDDLENPYYASGHVYAASCQDTLLCQAYFNPFITNVYEQMLGGLVFSVRIADVFRDLINKQYEMLFEKVLQHGYIPLGLYRKGRSLNYVQSNPPHDTILEEADAVYLLIPSTQALRRTKVEKVHVRRMASRADLFDLASKAIELKVFN